MKAIEDSKISYHCFLRNYASSIWYLEELVQILEWKNRLVQNVIPVFYQTRHFAEAFGKHGAGFKDKAPIWKKALTEVANLSGKHLDGTKYKLLVKILN